MPHAAKPVPSEPRHFAYIDAVRGLAFLAVLSNHVAKVDGRFPGWWIWNSGYYGVQFFFLASAITLCHSMESRKTKDKKPVISFYIRRLFRIGPMYWLAIILYWCLPFECLRSDWLRPFSGETGPAPLDFGLNAFFLQYEKANFKNLFYLRILISLIVFTCLNLIAFRL